MDNQRIQQSMVSCAKGYSQLIHDSIGIAISLDMDRDMLISIINEWVAIRKNIILELPKK